MIDILKEKSKKLVWLAYKINRLNKAESILSESTALLKAAKTPMDVIAKIEDVRRESYLRKIILKQALNRRLEDIFTNNGIKTEGKYPFISMSDLRRGYIFLNCDEEEPTIGTLVLYLTNGTVIKITPENINNEYLLPEINALEYHRIADL